MALVDTLISLQRFIRSIKQYTDSISLAQALNPDDPEVQQLGDVELTFVINSAAVSTAYGIEIKEHLTTVTTSNNLARWAPTDFTDLRTAHAILKTIASYCI